MSDLWTVLEDSFDPKTQHHKETIFTIGNGYLCTRGAFEEGYPGDHRATFVHGVFDAVPIVFTELANAPDWLPFTIYLNGERFALDTGEIERFRRILDLRHGVLTRTVRWRSPGGYAATITFERFASLVHPHLLCIRCRVISEFEGTLEMRAALNGNTDNDGLAHWRWVGQGAKNGVVYLHNRTRSSGIDLVSAMRLEIEVGERLSDELYDVENTPTQVLKLVALPGNAVIVNKYIAIGTTRDGSDLPGSVVEQVKGIRGWRAELQANTRLWEKEWERSDVIIEGDDEAQLALRFNIYHLLIAAPRDDERVNIGAKTLSGFGYRGHSFWDTEIFMLPMFTYTAPQIARNLLSYRFHNLTGAREKARGNGYEGAQFPWESADTGEEVTPTWVPLFGDKTKMVRIWTGDIEVHVSADIAYAAYQYWRLTGDDDWLIERGAELILDTAKFWASRGEWNAPSERYEYNDVIGPDENHEHVNNNFYTNRMAQWNLQTALEILTWLRAYAPFKAIELTQRLDLSEARLAHWKEVIAKITLPTTPSGLVEQFKGYFQRREVDLAAMEPREESVQAILGIEQANQTQVIKQPDVLMLMYLLRQDYSDDVVRINYDYYTPRTDHSYGSSLGPSIQAIMACEVGLPDEGYEHFIRAARADLCDARGNAGDGIHAASAGGTWQAAVFGFAGLHFTPQGWKVNPRLPKHWRRLAFKFYYHGQLQEVDVRGEE
jgi:kojibiose phosphorylase